jgi:iron complex transport system substrate-binding protein
MRKPITVVYAILMAAALLICHGQALAAEAFQPLTYEQNLDGHDYEFTIDKPVQRAVSMSQATTEMLLALGVADQMVGSCFLEEDIYEPLAAEYAKVKVMAEKWPSYEVFMAGRPDLATGWPVPFTKRAIEAAKIVERGVDIFVPESMLRTDSTLETTFDDLLTFGKMFGVEENAKKLVDEQKRKLAAVQDKLKGLPEKTVFIFDSEDDQPFTVYEGYTTNFLKLINARNVMSGRGVDQTWGKTSWEEVVAANPEYVVVCDYGVSIRNTDDFDQKVSRLKENPALRNVEAVKNDHFIRVKLSEITPGVRGTEALERLANEMHGAR